MKTKTQRGSVTAKKQPAGSSTPKKRKQRGAAAGTLRGNILESDGDFWESSALAVVESLDEREGRG